MEAKELLQSLNNGTKVLIDQHRKYAQQVKTLESQMNNQRTDLQQLAVDKENLIKENRELKEQIKTIKLAQSLSAGPGDQSSRQVKMKINEYIREIDKCLSLLNRE
ncbi:MAG: hypothetical protein ABI772_04415 [Bacteroidota bacterium]